jgi:hypothetical protein
MNHAFRTTFLMLAIAVVAAIAAASVYPWPESVIVSEAVNKPLFDEFNTSNVRSIRVETYNDDRNEIERLMVRRKGEEWILPGHNNFVADNGRQLGAAVNLLLDKIVLEKRSDNQEDHLKFGVVDPADINSAVNRSSLGKKISLSDRNNKELASLIVGLPLKNDPKQLKHYVRIPGQPGVYVVDIDPRSINPDFRAWVSPNLLKLSQATRLKDITVNSYRLDANNLNDAKRENLYQSQIVVGEQTAELNLKVANEDGELTESKPNAGQRQMIQQAAGSITSIPFTGVIAKPKSIARALRNPDKATESSTFDSMLQKGFRVASFENQTWQFDATGGSINVRTADGVVVSILIGAIDNQTRNNSLKLNHYLMLVAGFDKSLIPEPEKPSDEKEDSDDQVDSNGKDAQKAYLRKVADREKQVKIGQQRAAALNESFSRWYYVVSEDVVDRLRPELKSTE